MTRLKVDPAVCSALLTDTSVSRVQVADMYGLLSPPDSPKLQIEPTAKMIENARQLSIPKALPWAQFKQLVDAENLDPLGRSYAMQIAYELHKEQMVKQHGSIANHLIKHTLANFIAETQDRSFDASSIMAASDCMFLANDFPYYISDNVEHWVMWCKKRLEPGFEAPAAVIKAVQNQFGQSIEWRYFVNPVHRQSVPQLSHAHVFIKRN